MEEKMFLYTYHLISQLRGLPLTVEAFIFAHSFLDADRLFYWKILMEFTPQEYAHIVFDLTSSNCSEEDVSSQSNCNRGILNFTATFDGSVIRSIQKGMAQDRMNLHVGSPVYSSVNGVIEVDEQSGYGKHIRVGKSVARPLTDKIFMILITLGALFVLATIFRTVFILLGGSGIQ